MSDRKLMKIKAGSSKLPEHFFMDWQPIPNAPFDRDLQLAVIDADGLHALVFPCRRVLRGWLNAKTNSLVNVHPTHWRQWEDTFSPLSSGPAS